MVIMTSEDTHARTVELLEANNYFGMNKDKITILNQEKVPAMVDNEAHFGLVKDKL
jgi:UDP-sugar pyrophosphorylase